jgi:hypothetical protein
MVGCGKKVWISKLHSGPTIKWILIQNEIEGETGKRRPETGDRRPETGKRKAEGGRRKAEGGRRKAEGGRRKAESGRRLQRIPRSGNGQA